MSTAKVVGVCGGSGSGKTTIVNKIREIVPDFVFLPQDNYYRSSPPEAPYSFDHPEAFDTELLVDHLRRLRAFEPIDMPCYDFVRNRRLEEAVRVEPRKLVILEGIMIYFDRPVRDLIDLKLFVDTPDDIRFIRRLRRDLVERGRSVDSVIEQYISSVRPGHYEFVEPTKAYADLIIPEGGYNETALEVLISFMKTIVS